MNKDDALFDELNYHLINDEKPSIYLNALLDNNIFNSEFPFTLISNLKNIEQSPIHHPEGNVWNHTLLVVDNAAKRKSQSEDERIFMWSALLHDIGKADTTKIKKGKITAYDHDKVGASLAVQFLKEFTDDEKFIEKVSLLVRWHMQLLYVLKDLPFARIDEMKSQVSIKEVGLLALCDRLGRSIIDEKAEEENIRVFLEKCDKH